jgi:hypothetical protein
MAVCLAFGRTQGLQLYTFSEDWAVIVRAKRESIGIEEFVRASGYNRRKAYRRLALFRAAFTMLGPTATPEALMGPLLDQLASEAAREGER